MVASGTSTATTKKTTNTTRKKESTITPAPKRGGSSIKINTVSRCSSFFIVLQPMSVNVATPPRTKASAAKRVLVFDDFDRFSGVLRKFCSQFAVMDFLIWFQKPLLEYLDSFR